jgi:hypothetical protein
MLQIKAWKTKPNLKVLYDPELWVLHLVPHYKLSVWWILKEAYLKGYSQAYFWVSYGPGAKGLRKAPYHLCKHIVYFLMRNIPGLIFRNRKKYPFWQNYLTEVSSNKIQSVGVFLRQSKDLLIGNFS